MFNNVKISLALILKHSFKTTIFSMLKHLLDTTCPTAESRGSSQLSGLARVESAPFQKMRSLSFVFGIHVLRATPSAYHDSVVSYRLSIMSFVNWKLDDLYFNYNLTLKMAGFVSLLLLLH